MCQPNMHLQDKKPINAAERLDYISTAKTTKGRQTCRP